MKCFSAINPRHLVASFKRIRPQSPELTFRRSLNSLFFLLLLLTLPDTARANWSLNLGYQNPAVSTYGVNFLYMGSKWAFETGLGWIQAGTTDNADDNSADTTNNQNDADSKTKNDGDASLRAAGDMDLKYLFSSGAFRPFIQGGFGIGAGARSGDQGGASVGTGGGFAGVGFFLWTQSVYAYGSYNIGSSNDGFVQAGLGFDL